MPSRLGAILNEEQITKKHRKPLREHFGENEDCYIMDAKSKGNIGRYLNVMKLIISTRKVFWVLVLMNDSFFAAFLSTERICAECICGHTRYSIPMGSIFCWEAYKSRH